MCSVQNCYGAWNYRCLSWGKNLAEINWGRPAAEIQMSCQYVTWNCRRDVMVSLLQLIVAVLVSIPY